MMMVRIMCDYPETFCFIGILSFVVMFFMNSLYNKKIILTIHMNTLNIVCSFGKYAEIPCVIIKFLKI